MSPRRCRPAPTGLALLVAPLLVAATQEDGPHLVLEHTDGTLRELPVEGLDLSDPREMGGWLIRPRALPLGLIGEAPQPASEETAWVELANGDRLRGRVAGGEGETLHFDLLGAVRLPIDVGNLRSIVFPGRLPSASAQELRAPGEGDRLYRVSGASLDRVDGTLEEFSEQGLGYDSLIGSTLFSWDEVAALFVELLEEAPREAEPSGTPVVVDLVEASRVRGRLQRLSAEGAELSVAGGGEVLLELSWIEEILVDDGSLGFLSAMQPAGEEGFGSPFGDDLGMLWPHRLDRSVIGEALRSGSRSYARGIGMHAPSRVRWELDGSWSELRGLVAIDDSALLNPERARGSVIFRVHGDGELLWESELVRGGELPLPFSGLPLSGVQELVLEADPAGEFSGDRANWLRVLVSR